MFAILCLEHCFIAIIFTLIADQLAIMWCQKRNGDAVSIVVVIVVSYIVKSF